MNAKRKLLVTGARGFVAGSILAQAGDDWEVHAISRGAELARPSLAQWHVCDALDQVALGELLFELRPEVVIHTAALADIDFCQTHPELARAVNVDLTRNLARLCSETGTRLVFCSTDTIFDGEHAPYTEEDKPGPVNFYAETKVGAEQIVGELGAQAVIARLSLVVGLPVFGAGNSFLAKMVDTFKKARTVAMPEYEVRTPFDVITAGRALLELAGGNHQGIFHLAGNTRVNRFEMSQLIAERFGFPKHLVVGQPLAASSGRAARPRDVSLSNHKVCAQLKTPMRTLDEGLSLILQTEGARDLPLAAASS